MPSQGPLYPGTVATQGVTPEDANDWLTPANLGADDGSEAQITAATYDSPDISFRLIPQNYGFTIPAGSTINGVVVEIDRRSIIASSGKDYRVQLYSTSGGLLGDNKAVPATIWPTTSTVATYGGAADGWNASLTTDIVNFVGFGVALAVQANIANADIGVDFIRVTVHYTTGPVTVTPGVVALVLTTFAPTVTATDHQTVTPDVAALILTTFAPTVTAVSGTTVTPDTASLSLATFAPTVTATANQTVVPTTASLSLATFAPTVTASNHQVVTPGVAALTLTTFAPNVGQPVTVTPGVASLSLATFAPTVTTSAHVTVVPAVASLSLAAFAPTVTSSAHVTVTPGVVALALSTFAPTVAVGGSITVTPTTAALALTAFAPSVQLSGQLFSGAPPLITSAGRGDSRITDAYLYESLITEVD